MLLQKKITKEPKPDIQAELVNDNSKMSPEKTTVPVFSQLCIAASLYKNCKRFVPFTAFPSIIKITVLLL